MQKKDLIKIIQGYIGMTPKDAGCNNWSEIQEKMYGEIMSLIGQEPSTENKVEFSEELKNALSHELWKAHKVGDSYTMDGKPLKWKIAYYPLFGTYNNVKNREGNSLETRWTDFVEPRALVEAPAVFNGEPGIDYREVPLRYLAKCETN